MILSRHFTSEQDLKSFAEHLGEYLELGDSVFFEGPLGVGKSTFIRALLRYICKDPNLEVPSPTFTFVQTYDTPKGEVWHVDLYRAERKSDVVELGVLDVIDKESIVLLEWPEKLRNIRLSPNSLLLHFDYGNDPEERLLTLLPQGYWQDRMKKILGDK